MEFKDYNLITPSVQDRESEKSDNSAELLQEISSDPPAVESFLDPAKAAEVWSESIATNKVFLDQLKKRKELSEHLNDVLDRLPRPDISLEAAISQGQIIEDQATKLYASLSDLFESNQDYGRLVLYLPFEFLPNKNWQPSNEALQQTADRFREAYMATWRGLLSTYDVRANFVDGDVLEVEQRTRDLPRVVKAAHLIPKLVENGLMKVEDVFALMEESDDQILRDSIADTLPVLADMGFIGEKEIELMEKSKDWLVGNMARIIVSGMNAKKQVVKKPLEAISLLSVKDRLLGEFYRIDTEDFGDITEKRKVWLNQKKRQDAIEASGEEICAAIVEGKLADKVIAEFLPSEENVTSQQALIEGLRKAIESIATTDIEHAHALYAHYEKTLLTIWENNKPETRESLSKTFRRLHQLNIADDKQLADLNIIIPKLAGPFSENIELMKNGMQEIRKMIALIESKPELSQLIYPAILVFGSRLKGYGEQSADIDLGIFVKPGVSIDDRKELQYLLKEIFSHEKIQGEVVEFWLEEEGSQLNVRDFSKHDVLLGESCWTHILFGAAWEGDGDAIKELREKLLVSYLFETDKVLHGHKARDLYLEEMERDVLQYRLMHKGYERFFPKYGGIHTPHADEIDGESMFWDSGYRQLATKLFTDRVFLPKISRP